MIYQGSGQSIEIEAGWKIIRLTDEEWERLLGRVPDIRVPEQGEFLKLPPKPTIPASS